jgi:hypothetical protein
MSIYSSPHLRSRRSSRIAPCGCLTHTHRLQPIHRVHSPQQQKPYKQWDPTRSTTREVRQLTAEALSAGCIALTVALHLTASHVEVATILQLVVAGVGTVLAVVAMAMRPADLKPPVTLCAAGIFSAVQVALIAYPSSLQRWVESNTVALEIAFYAIDGEQFCVALYQLPASIPSFPLLFRTSVNVVHVSEWACSGYIRGSHC